MEVSTCAYFYCTAKKDMTPTPGSMLLKQKNNDQITYWRAKKISVSCKTKQAVNIDDEVIPLKKLMVSVLPKAVRVVVPIGSII